MGPISGAPAELSVPRRKRSNSVVVAGVHVEAGMPSARNISTLRRSSSKASRSSKPAGSELPDRRLLEVAGQLVVAPGPHDRAGPSGSRSGAARPRSGGGTRCGRAVSSTIWSVGIEQVEDRAAPLRSPGPRRTRRRTTASPGGATRGSAGGRRRPTARRRCRPPPPRPGTTGSSRQVQCSGTNGRPDGAGLRLQSSVGAAAR